MSQENNQNQTNKIWHLFEAYGIELEYMLVNQNSLQAVPLADLVLGETGELNNGVVSWSNELAKHIIEIKTTGPKKDLLQASLDFQDNIRKINNILKPQGACLLPTAAHPWLDPKDAELWHHECTNIYKAYDRIFNCQGHGWVNLQSTHLNLPFANDQEFKILHTAIRVLLPILPALAASSPFLDFKPTGLMDTRLKFYNQNQKNIPEISAKIIPELVFSQGEYQEKILEKSYQAISSYDPEGLLKHEWLNSRGAIARFSRMAIEIRILDIQECPKMDISIVGLIIEILKKLVDQSWADFDDQASFSEEDLSKIYQESIVHGMQAKITNSAYLKLFGLENKNQNLILKDLWQHCVNKLGALAEPYLDNIKIILESGCLAERMLKNYSKNPSPEKIREIYQDLRLCLERGEAYV